MPDRVLNGITVTAAYYQRFIHSELNLQIQKLRHGKINSNMSILYDNARLHVAQPIIDLFIDYAWETLRHSP